MKNTIKKEFQKLGLNNKTINGLLEEVLNNENNSKLNLDKINESLRNANIKGFLNSDSLDNNIGIKFAEDLMLDLIGLASRKEVNLEDVLLKDFNEVIIMVYNFNNRDLIKLIENLAIELRESFINLVNRESWEIYRKRKLKTVQISSAAYNKEFFWIYI